MTKTLINTFGTRFYHKNYKDFIKGLFQRDKYITTVNFLLMYDKILILKNKDWK